MRFALVLVFSLVQGVSKLVCHCNCDERAYCTLSWRTTWPTLAQGSQEGIVLVV